MVTKATWSQIDLRKATVPRRLALLIAALALATGFGIGRWQMAGHHAGSTPSETSAPSVASTALPMGAAGSGTAAATAPLEAFPDVCPCDLSILTPPAAVVPPAVFPLEAFPNGCPCDLSTLTTAAAGATPVTFPLEAFPNGCPCDLSTLTAPSPR